METQKATEQQRGQSVNSTPVPLYKNAQLRQQNIKNNNNLQISTSKKLPQNQLSFVKMSNTSPLLKATGTSNNHDIEGGHQNAVENHFQSIEGEQEFIYVKKKEKELRDLVFKITEKSENTNYKDEKMQNLERSIKNIREDQLKLEKVGQELRDKVKFWKSKSENLESEVQFLKKQTQETKKKNQLLKMALGILQKEIDQLKKIKEEEKKIEKEKEKRQFFITDLLQAVETPQQPNLRIPPSKQALYSLNVSMVAGEPLNMSQIQDLSTLQNSVTLEPQSLLETSKYHRTNNKSFLMQQPFSYQHSAQAHHKRVQSTSASRYANIPAENIKFQKFVDLLFDSKLSSQERSEELKKYVQALESHYSDVIRDLRTQVDGLINKVKAAQSQKTNQMMEKSELETLFIDCIEEVRRDVMKRRLKSQLLSRRKLSLSDATTILNENGNSNSNNNNNNSSLVNSNQAQEFEESLLKLANLAKSRIKLSDFNAKDKLNLLDLFVNNEKTLIQIYEILFPHRQSIKDKVGSSRIGGYGAAAPSQQNNTSNTQSQSIIYNSDLVDLDTFNEKNKETSKSPLDYQDITFVKKQEDTRGSMLPRISGGDIILSQGFTGNERNLSIGRSIRSSLTKQ